MGKWQKGNTDLRALRVFLSFRGAVPAWGNRNINFAETPEKVKVAVLQCLSTGGRAAGILNRLIPCARLSWIAVVAQLCPFCDPMHCSPQASLSSTISWSLLRFMFIEWMMSSNHLILWSPYPPALNLCQHQGLFQWVGSSHKVAEILELQHQGMAGHLLSLSSEGTSCDWATQAGMLSHSQSFPWGSEASGWEDIGFAKPVSWKPRTSSWAQTRQFQQQPLGEQGCACPRSWRLGKKRAVTTPPLLLLFSKNRTCFNSVVL